MPQVGRPCPLRARSGGKTWALTVNHGTNTTTVTCMSTGRARTSRSPPSWCYTQVTKQQCEQQRHRTATDLGGPQRV